MTTIDPARHNRIVAALRRLMNCPDVSMDDIEGETCDAMDEAEAALAGEPAAAPEANLQLLRDIRDYWWKGEIPIDLMARMNAAIDGGALQTHVPRDTLDLMCNELEAWCKAHGLPVSSADEVLMSLPQGDVRRAYLESFIRRWDAINQQGIKE